MLKVNTTNRWLIAGTFLAIASLATIIFSPRIIGSVMGYSGDGVGQFFYALILGGGGLIVLVLSCIFLLVLSLMAWLS